MRFCTYCDETLWPDAPDTMTVRNNQPFCSESCEQRERYERRRGLDDRLYWTHDCEQCGRPMFAPAFKSGWWCPECDRVEDIDDSYWTWYKDQHHGWDGEFEHPCPECESTLWLFDGALVCHNDDCDVYIVQYAREWWALIETEYPSKTLSKQSELSEIP